ncbi:alpha/beta hydrolase [Gelidibacter pelagius]|uniref:Alpha/beta hydrolase n=1 Tax=Gelidibacter pelagius TaxID=2819985 RepID=A0ABS3SXV5_9FLAO|nr:alpha/beta hydrolase [Gelidibacter pelagius]MBO3100116.1 alpha/beta hydrolase [Gelidibacter pelagius]
MSNIPRTKNKLKKVLLFLVALYLMIGASLYLLQEKILFLPTVLPQDYQYEFNHPFEEVFLKTEADAVINAIHFKIENPKGVILYFHGNAGDLSRWGTIAEVFVNMDYDVLIMDYRTYGKSTGKLSEAAFYKDAQHCYDYLKASYSDSKITLYGRSLGTGIATYLASKNKAKQLILETPYYSMVDVAKSRFPFLPVEKLLQYKFPTNEFITSVECPIVVFHGTDDGVVPFESGKKLFDIAPKLQATFVEIEGGGHNDLINFKVYRNGIEEALK